MHDYVLVPIGEVSVKLKYLPDWLFEGRSERILLVTVE